MKGDAMMGHVCYAGPTFKCVVSGDLARETSFWEMMARQTLKYAVANSARLQTTGQTMSIWRRRDDNGLIKVFTRGGDTRSFLMSPLTWLYRRRMDALVVKEFLDVLRHLKRERGRGHGQST